MQAVTERMPGRDRLLFGWKIFMFLTVLLFCGGIVAQPLLYAQERGPSRKAEVGILVIATAAQANDALLQLKSGADFHVLAKEKSIRLPPQRASSPW